jgi:HK97 family phage major capsid protein
MLVGTTTIPQPQFSTLSDGTTVTAESEPVFTGGSAGANSLIFSPLRLSFKAKVSNQLFKQSASVFEPVLKDLVSRGISSMIDNLALFGSGTSGQPLGVYSTVTPVNLTTTPLTWSGTLPNGYVNYREAVRESDLDPDSYGVIISPAMENYLDATQFASGASYTLLDKIKDGSPDRVFCGNEISTSSPSGAKAIFLGLWRFLTIMTWAEGVEVVLDRYSSADTFETVVRANVLANVGISFPSAFQAIRQN